MGCAAPAPAAGRGVPGEPSPGHVSSSPPARVPPQSQGCAPSVWGPESWFQESLVGRGGQEGVREERHGDSRVQKARVAWAPGQA